MTKRGLTKTTVNDGWKQPKKRTHDRGPKEKLI